MTAKAPRYQKPESLARIPAGVHAVIEASAGTGKTYALEHLVLELLLVRKLPIEQILAVTFTDKAARELTDRVRSKLEELFRGGWREAPASVPDSLCWTIDEGARRLLEQALFSFDMASISTIHAFCQRVLTDHAFTHGRLFEQKAIPPLSAFSEAFRAALREDFPRDPRLRPWLDLWLRHRGKIKPLEELLLECNKAGGRIRPELPEENLAQAAIAFGAGMPVRTPGGAPVKIEAVVAGLFLPVVLARTHARKALTGEYDYDDMLAFVAESLDGPRSDELVSVLRRRYRCALIDEFQDTDILQWKIFRKIFFESGGANPLFLIGDPKQAIYAFRGADVETYLTARGEILDAGGALVPLTENYRSTPGLIAATNAILDQSARDPFFTGAIRYDEPVTAARGGFTALDAAGKPAPPIHLLRPVSAGSLRAERLRTVLAERIAREIRALLDAEKPALSLSESDRAIPLRARDIFVLTRTKDEGYLVGERLRAAGIPHVYFKQEGLFQTDEAEDISHLLQALEEPQDRSRRFRAWLTPFFGLRLSDLEGSEDLPGTHPLMQRLLDWKALADAKDYSRLFAQIVEESGLVRRELFLKESERKLTNYLHVFELLLEEAGRSKSTLEELNRRLSAYIHENILPEGQDGNVQRLESEKDAVQIMTIHKAKGLEAAVVFVFGGFFGQGSTEKKVRTYHEGSTRVAYVGSEAPREIKDAVKKESQEEDQRLLYVALTRAQARVYLPCFAGAKVTINGPYLPMSKALTRVAGASVADPALRGLFTIEDIAYDPPKPGSTPEPAPDLSRWHPPTALLEQRDLSAAFREIRIRRAGFVVESYTGLKRGAGYQAPEDALEDAADEPVALLPEAGAPEELPGGRASGVFLHKILEEIPFKGLAAGTPFSRWAEDETVAALFEKARGRYGRDARHLEHSRRLVHTALTAPVLLPNGDRVAGLSRASRTLREVEFLYPIPEKSHPPISSAIASGSDLERFRIERGFIKGFVDLLFEHEGLTYFLDWKSDSLPRWDADFLAAHVERNYRLQAKLYGLALVKMLGVHDRSGCEKRFGGFLYGFVRGMRAPGSGVEGIYARRPDWTEIEAWEEDLLRPDFLPAEVEAVG
jgi:exodeoxyribonuclease V beta subunit